MTQPEALRLADMPEALQLAAMLEAGNNGWPSRAAAELRRLYELAMDQQGKIYALEMARSMQQKTAKLKRDALLEALKEIVDAADGTGRDQLDASFTKARAAIAKATGEV